MPVPPLAKPPPLRFARRWLYSGLILPTGLVLLWLMSWRNRKLRAVLAERGGLWKRLEEQLEARDPARPLIWFHVASAGELLQALPVLRRFLADGAQCALTVTSPSGMGWAAREREQTPGLILADTLPLDLRRNARRMIRLLTPAVLVYVKYDLWPNLAWEAQRAGVPQFLLCAALNPGTTRGRSSAVRWFYRAVYGALTGIFTVSEADRRAYRDATPEHVAVEVGGDTKYDTVLERMATPAPHPLSGWAEEHTVLVAGSTWPGDEARILPPLAKALAAYPELGLIVAPHEPSPERVRAIEAALAGVKTAHLSALTKPGAGPGDCRAVVVDSVGQLAALYGGAAAAYVGGGFGAGVHNVLEPAAAGVPVLLGPRHRNAPEAAALVSAGGAFCVEDERDFRRKLLGLLDDPDSRRRAGAAALEHVREKAGAARIVHERITACLEGKGQMVKQPGPNR